MREIPFLGLNPFSEKDGPFFFGRDERKRVIARSLKVSRLTVLFGESGVGKSSILQAGVVPLLRRDAEQNRQKYGSPRLAIVVFKNWYSDAPLQSLLEQTRTAVAEAMNIEPNCLEIKSPSVETLQNWAKILGGEQEIGQLFLILDQFEEYFQRHPQESGEWTFANEFPRWVNRSDLRVNFLIGIRQDALSSLYRFKESILNIFDNQVELAHLDRSAAQEAIVKPVGEYNLRQVIANRLQTSRLSVLSGDRGLGKSRVLRAISENLEEVIIFSSWRSTPIINLIQQTEASLKARFPQLPDSQPGASLTDILKEWSDHITGKAKNSQLFIILDQFEEFFQYQAPDLSERSFIAEFSRAVNAPELSSVHFLIAIRDEAQDLLKHFEERIPNIFDYRLQIKKLGRKPALSDLVNPIEEPAQQLSETISIEPELVEEVLNQISPLSLRNLAETIPSRVISSPTFPEKVEIEAPLLQLVMKRIWEEEMACGSRCLHLQTLKNQGGVKKIAERHLNQAMASLSTEQQAIMATIFQYLVTPSGTKNICRSDDLASYTHCSVSETNDLLEILADKDHRIVRPVEERRYVIFHDVLAQPILNWRIQYLEKQKRTEELAEKLAKEEKKREDLKHLFISFIVIAIVTTAFLIGGTTGLKIWQLSKDLEITEQQLISIDAMQRAETSSQLMALQDSMKVVQTIQNEKLQQAAPTATLALQKILSGIQEQNQFQVLAARGFTANQAILSPAGDLAAASFLDGTVSVWNLKGGKLIDFKAYDGLISRISFLEDGQRLVTAAMDGTIATWNLQGQRLTASKLPQKAGWVVNLSPDGQRLATTDAKGTVGVWTLEGKQVIEFHAHRGWVLAVSFSPDGQRLATAGQDDIVRLWDLQGNRLAELKGHQGSVYFVKFGPKGQQLMTGGQDGTIRLWNLKGEELKQFKQEKGSVYYLGISPDGAHVATASADGVVRLWDDQGNRLAEFRGHENVVADISFNQDRKHLATITRNGTVRVWNLHTQQSFQAYPEGTFRAQIRFKPDGQSLVTAAESGISEWSLAGNRSGTKGGNVLSSFFSKVGSLRFVLASQDAAKGIDVWDFQQDQPLATFKVPEGMVWKAEVSPDEKWLFTTTFGVTNKGQLWNMERPQDQPQELTHPNGAPVMTVGFSADGQKLATAALNGEVALWNISTSLDRPLVSFAASEGSFVTALEFSPNGQQLVTASWDNTASLWNLQGKQLRKFKGHRASINNVHFSRDGLWLLTSSLDGTARLWDLQGEQWAEYPGHSDSGILDAVFSPDGNQVAAISLDGYVQLWTVEPFNQLVEKGCNWLTDYLAIHPEAQKQLTLCNIQ